MSRSAANCFDVVGRFIDAMAGTGIPYQVLGGVSVLPFLDAVSVEPEARRVVAAAGLLLPSVRDNGSLRDLDVLVLSTDDAVVGRAQAIASRAIGHDLETAVFGIRPLSQLRQQEAHPLGSVFRVFLGDRYAEQDSTGRVVNLHRALFPFAVAADPSSLDTWTVRLESGHEMPIQRPASIIAGYLVRSISGLRPKDQPKVAHLTTMVHSHAPGEIEWLTTGGGVSLTRLARALHTLREPGSRRARPLAVGPLVIEPLERRDLGHLDDFMLRDAPPTTRRAVLAISSAKARALHRLEGSGRVVGVWQRRGFEDAVRGIIRNEA